MSCKRCVEDVVLELVPLVPKPGNKFTRGVKNFLDRGRFIQDYYNAALRSSALDYSKHNSFLDRNQFRFSYRYIPKGIEEEYAYYISHFISARTNIFSSYKYHNIKYRGKGKLYVDAQSF